MAPRTALDVRLGVWMHDKFNDAKGHGMVAKEILTEDYLGYGSRFPSGFTPPLYWD